MDSGDGESGGRTKNEKNIIEMTGRTEKQRQTVWNVTRQLNYITLLSYTQCDTSPFPIRLLHPGDL